MKIVLAEEAANGVSSPPKTFTQPVVRVGRSFAEAEIEFENKRYPMVSRRHAELRYENNRWLAVDLGSSYGTFIDGQQIEQPTEIFAGSRLQFGADGPVLSVREAETDENFHAAKTQNSPVSERNAERFNIPNFDPLLKSHSQISPPKFKIPQLEFADGSHPPFKISKPSIFFGRDPQCDVGFPASALMVSRRHAEIKQQNGEFFISDFGSFNGTLINERRISAPTRLCHQDQIQFGIGGPILLFNAPSFPAAPSANITGQTANPLETVEAVGSQTMTFNRAMSAGENRQNSTNEPQLLTSHAFGSQNELTVGRGEHNDIRLDGLQISNRHAKLTRRAANITIEDSGSTNGVYVNGQKISKQTLEPEDSAQIGAFLIRVLPDGKIGVFDTRSKTRIDAVNLTKIVKIRGAGRVKLLDQISLSIEPNEFVGLLGPSGAGKSTLIEALNGMRAATSGSVLINNLDLYQNLSRLKQSIGYVPQSDIIHPELTVERTLFYVAKLRLSSDVSANEIKQVIGEVLDLTNLSERRHAPVGQLSGGERKRVSIAVELITKPSIIFLDEPTSGLDPATEEKIMKLFRQISESGRTVVLTTHAMENIKLFDKIVVLMRGRLAFYGTPAEALRHFQTDSFKELYDKIEEPVERRILTEGEANRAALTEQTAEDWKQKFLNTAQYRQYVEEPLKRLGQIKNQSAGKKNRLGIFGSIRQFAALSRRYAEILFKDKLNLLILLAQAPLIALMTFLVMGANKPRDFVYFVLSLVAVWFGTSAAAREIVRERAVYRRERMFDLGILPYLASKIFVLGIIVGAQCLLMFVPLKVFDLLGMMPMPGELFGIPQIWAMLLTAGVGIALGLLISALVKTSRTAASLVPLVLIPQILFSGLVGVPEGASRVVSLTMPAAWSFDTIKRFSTLDTLEPEGAEPNGKTRGKGLYKSIEIENDKVIADAKKNLDEYQSDSQKKLENYEANLRNGQIAAPPDLDAPPPIGDAKNIPEDLSGYITFLHPWMNEVLNQIVLMIMFFMLTVAALIVLRLQDLI